MTSDQERAAPAQQPVAWGLFSTSAGCLSVTTEPAVAQKWAADCKSGFYVDSLVPALEVERHSTPSEPELRAEIVHLTRERDEARGIVRDIHWMAVRYADNRKSYAVGMCNDALRKAYDGGWLVYKGDKRHALDPQYARHGLFDAEWRSAVDAATGRAEAAESRVEALSAEVGKLTEALKDLYKGYVNTLENGRDRIIGFGGTYDPVDVMERGDPWLARARAALDNGATS